MSKASEVKTSYRTGLAAEALCRLILRLKMYRIVASRWRSPRGEVDIIACKGKILAMIEVKARDTETLANEAILPRQRHRLEAAAQDFIAKNPRFLNHNWRFDIMLVTPKALPKHIVDAWRPVI